MDPWLMIRLYLMSTTSHPALSSFELRRILSQKRLETMHDALPAREWQQLEHDAQVFYLKRRARKVRRR